MGMQYHIHHLSFSYFESQTKRTKISNCFSKSPKINGVPQGSILGPLFVIINLIDMFYECEDSHCVKYRNFT